MANSNVCAVRHRQAAKEVMVEQSWHTGAKPQRWIEPNCGVCETDARHVERELCARLRCVGWRWLRHSVAMPTWNADQYLQFANERTQPAIDLANRIALPSPRTVVDLGCGPGNSTAVVAARWPKAKVSGVDNSVSMLAAARRDQPEREWIQADITAWAHAAAAAKEKPDVVF